MNKSLKCPFCDSAKSNESFLPGTIFNQKHFDYYRCQECQLVYIHPLPYGEDLLKMYPTTYQNGIDATILKNPENKLIGLRFSYAYQFKIIKEHNITGKFLDYGCGAANFILNAKSAKIDFQGAEFNDKHVDVLKKEIPQGKFYTIEELLKSELKFDLIRISNVFEHFTQPNTEFENLIALLKPNGHILVEGPIEMNFNFAKLFRQMYFQLKKRFIKGYRASHTPTHIFFTNRKNQIEYFQKFNLNTKHWKINEAEWPFPPSMQQAKGLVSKLNFLIARLSMMISRFNPNWGNTFIYLGQKSDHGS